MTAVGRHTQEVTGLALRALHDIEGLTVYGPARAADRSPLAAFNIAGINPVAVAEALNRMGVESRAGCHCATLAHRDLGLTPPASCRLSFALYTSTDDVERAVTAVRTIIDRDRPRPAGRIAWSRPESPAAPSERPQPSPVPP